MSDRKPGNCLSWLGRVETAVKQTLGFCGDPPFATGIFLHPDQRPSLRGLAGEFWPAGELNPIGLRRPNVEGFWISALMFIIAAKPRFIKARSDFILNALR